MMAQQHRIGLISGTGAEGRGIALRLASAGLQLSLGSRSQDRARAVAARLNHQLGREGIIGVDNHALVAQSDLLFLTVPFTHVDSVLQEHRHRFSAGQILVDVTVPVVFDGEPSWLELKEGSAAEYIRSRLSSDLPVVAAFKTLPAHLLCHLDAPMDCNDFVCSDSAQAKRRVLEVVSQIQGLRWIDAGPLRAARELEAMTFLAIGINRRYKVKFTRFRVLGLEDSGS